jgi:putative DNA primase/helicase
MHPSAHDVACALADQVEVVAQALLGEPNRALSSRRELRFGKGGSVAVCITGGKQGSYFDHQEGRGGDLLHLIAHTHGVGIGDAIKIAKRDFLGQSIIRSAPSRSASQASRQDTVDEAKTAKVVDAARLWSDAVPLPGTLGERYFIEHRGLDVRLLHPLDHALRWHQGINAVIGLMTNAVTGEPTGVQRIFLRPDGNNVVITDEHGRKRKKKMMLGRHGVVRLSPDDEVTMGLGIVEGIEDGLAVMLSDWPDIWAAMGTSGVRSFPVLSGIEMLTVFADADTAGEEAAQACLYRWLAAGREARVVAPSLRWAAVDLAARIGPSIQSTGSQND